MLLTLDQIEAAWASLTGYERKEMLQKVGHKELFGITADGMTIAQICARFGERTADAVIQKLEE